MMALLDGVIVRETLGWHRPASDGVTSGAVGLLAWVGVLVALALLWRARSRFAALGSAKILYGSGFLGAGFYALVEALLFHQLLGWHHVSPTGDAAWDALPLAVGAILVPLGLQAVARGTRQDALARRADRSRAW